MTISFSGLASGLDTSSWVESLVALKQAKVETLEEEKENVLSLQETLSNIKSFFSSFRSMLEKVTDAKFGVASMDLFAQNLATSTNLDVLTASVTPEAEEAEYNVLVDKLATETSAMSNFSYMTTIIQTTTATNDSKLINLGVKAGNIGVNVNGIEHGITITENDTIATFIEKLKNIGVEASYNEDTGVFSMNIDDGDINDIDGTGIVDALHLEGVNEGYTSNNLQTSKTDTVYSAATESTLMSDLGVQAGVITVHANDTDYDITISDTSTLGSFIADLQANGIEAELDATGVFTISDAEITAEGSTNILDALGLSVDIYGKTQTSGDLTLETIVTQVTEATSSTLLKDLGDGISISDGQTVIVKNSNNEYSTITVGTTTTLGELLQEMTNAGLHASLNTDGTVEIAGGTIEGGTFDVENALGLEREPYTAIVTGDALTETVEVHKLVDLQTKLVDDLKVEEGYLEVTDADGNKFYEKIYSGQTIADFMTDMGNLGIATSLDEDTGILTITGGAFKTLTSDEVRDLVTDGTIRETDPRYIQGTNLLECLYGSGTISTDHITVASTYSKSQALSYAATNTINASLTTTLENLGLAAAGTAVFDVRGESRTVNVSQTMTIQDLMDTLQNEGIASSWDSDNSKITIENAVLTGGTSNLADVLNLTTTISGKYVTSNELYVKEEVSAEATEDTLLSNYGILNSMSEAERTVNLYNSDGTLVDTMIVDESTSIGNLLDWINSSADVTATLENGVFTIHNGYLENDVLEASMGLKSSNLNSYVLGSVMTVTTSAAVTGETTLGEIISALGTTDKVQGGYTLNFNGTDLAVSASTKINELINMIYSNGGTASLDNTGRLAINGGVLTGTVAEALGMHSVTHTSSVSATGETLYTGSETFADRNTTFGELGVADDTYGINTSVYNSKGEYVVDINMVSNNTLGDFFDVLKANGIHATIADGVITLNSPDGNYITGDIADLLGIESVTSTTVINTTQSSTAGVTYTDSVFANENTLLSALAPEGWTDQVTNNKLTFEIKNSNQDVVGNIEFDFADNPTIGDFLDALAAYDIQGSITNGVISLYSPSGNYVEGYNADSIAYLTGMLGISSVEGTSTTYTVSQSVSSSIAVTYTTGIVATADTALKDVGIFNPYLGGLIITPILEAETPNDVMVSTADELHNALANATADTRVILTNNIDMTGYDWQPIDTFSGTLEGNGYTISNLTLTHATANNQVFMFNTISDATIQNIAFANTVVNTTNSTGGVLAYSISNSELNHITIEEKWGGGGGANVAVASSITDTDILGLYVDISSTASFNIGIAGNIQGGSGLDIAVTGDITMGGMYIGIAENLTNVNWNTVNTHVKADAGSVFVGSSITNSSLSNIVYDAKMTDEYGMTIAASQAGNPQIVKGSFDKEMLSAMAVVSATGEEVARLSLSGDSTFDEIFTQLAQYGIIGSISDGVVTLSSTNGNYVTGLVPMVLGIGAVQKEVVTITTGTTTTSTAAISYTQEIVATTDTTLKDLGITNLYLPIKFNPILEAQTPNDILVGTAEELHNALANATADTRILLTNNIDMTGYDWQMIDSFSGTLEGNGFTLSNLNLNGNAMFSIISDATIQNISFADATVTDSVLLAGAINNSNLQNISIDENLAGSTAVGLAAALYNTNLQGIIVNINSSANNTFGLAYMASGGTGLDIILTGEVASGGSYLGLAGQFIDVTWDLIQTHVKAPEGSYILSQNEFTENSINVTYDPKMKDEYGMQLTTGQESDILVMPYSVDRYISSPMAVISSTGELVAELNLTENSSIGDIFNQLAQYGIVGSISDGVIHLDSTNGNYVTGILTYSLGIDPSKTGTQTITTAQTATSTLPIMYTETVEATGTTTLQEVIYGPINGTITADGVTGDVIGISTAQEMQWLAEQVNAGNNMSGKTFILQNNISLSSISDWESIGNSAANAFAGTFDGGGYQISYMKQSLDVGEIYGGLFGNVNAGVIKNLTIANSTINVNGSDDLHLDGAYVGLAAGSINNTTISSVFVQYSRINSTRNEQSEIGGIAGLVTNSSGIARSYFRNSTISVAATSTSGTTSHVGGLVGKAENGTQITYSYNSAFLTGNAYSYGGIVGHIEVDGAQVYILGTYNTGNINQNRTAAQGNAGSIVGYITSPGTGNVVINQSYSNVTVNSNRNKGAIVGQLYSASSGTSGKNLLLNATYSSSSDNLIGMRGSYFSINDSTSESGLSIAEIASRAQSNWSDTGNWNFSSSTSAPTLKLYEDYTIVVNRPDGRAYTTIALDGGTTLDTLVTRLNSYVDAELKDGIITINPKSGQYYITGGLANELGIATTDTTVGAAATSTAAIEYTETVLADASTTLLETKYKIDGTITASGVTGTVIGIGTAAELQYLANLVNSGQNMSGKTFVLTNDISLSGISWKGIGDSETRAFKGTFDGMGHTISNMSITVDSTTKYNGLFGYAENATIKNVRLKNAVMNIGSTADVGHRGGFIVGEMSNGTVSGVTVSIANYNGRKESGAYRVFGGIVGVMDSGTISNAKTTALTVTNSDTTGGILGSATRASGDHVVIDKTYSQFQTQGYQYIAGGIVGHMNSKSANSNSTLTITNSQFAGALTSNGIIITGVSGPLTTEVSYNGGILGYFQVVDGQNNQVQMSHNYVSGAVGQAAEAAGLFLTATDVHATSGYSNNIATITQNFYKSQSVSDIADYISGVVTVAIVQTVNDSNFTYSNASSYGFTPDIWDTMNKTVKISDEYTLLLTGTGYRVEETGTFNGSSTIGDIIEYLNNYGTANITNGKLNFTSDTYGLEGGLTSLENQTHAYKKITMSDETMLKDLGLSTSSRYTVALRSGGNNYTVTVTGSQTVGSLLTQLAGYGISGKVDNGKLVLGTSQDAYITSMAATLANKLKISVGNGYTYTTSRENTDSDSLNYVNIDNADLNTTFGELGGQDGWGLEYRDENGSLKMITFKETDTISNILTKLNSVGITASYDENTGFTIGSETDKVHLDGGTVGALEALHIQGLDFYTTRVEETYVNKDSQKLSNEEVTTLNTNTTFADLGLTSNSYVYITSNGNNYTVTLSTDMTVGDMISALASFGISGFVRDGKLSLTGTENSYIRDIYYLLEDALGLNSGEGFTYETKDSVQYVNTPSNKLEFDKTFTMTTTSTFEDLGLTADGYITVVTNGTEHIITVTPEKTVDDIISTIAGFGISADVQDGKITFTANNGCYIKDMTTNVKDALKISAGKDQSWVTEEGSSWINTDSNVLTEEKSDLLITGDTVLSTIAGFDNGNGNLIVHKTDGTFVTITVDETQTVEEFFEQISQYGLVGTIDSEGKATITGIGNVYLQAAADGSNILEALKLGNLVENVEKVTVNTPSDILRYTTKVAATGATILENLMDTTGNSIAFSASNQADLVIDTYSDAGEQHVTLQFTKTQSLYDVIDALAAYGINASIDSNGRFSINSPNLSDFDISGTLGEFIMGNYTKDYGTDTTNNISTNLVQTTVTGITDNSLLADLGVTDGDILVTQQGVNYTVNIDTTNITTVGDFRNLLAGYGFSSSIDSMGRLSVTGVGESYLTSVSGGSNILEIFGLEDWNMGEITQNSDYLGGVQEHITKVSMSAKLSELTDAAGTNLGITGGQIYVYQDGTRNTINIDTNDTLETLAAKLSQYGISMGISQDGKLYLDGNNNSYLTTNGILTSNASNILEKLGIADNWETRYDSTSDNLKHEQEGNNVVTGSTLLSDLQDAAGNKLGITEGTYYVYSNGVRNTETITADMTVNDFMAVMAKYGLVADIAEDGSISVGAYNNTYLATSALAGQNSNIVSTLFAEWDFVNIYTSNGLDIPTDEIRAITEDTKLADINEGTYVDGNITVIKDGVQTNISLSADDTVGTLMDKLALYGFESLVNGNGQLVIKNTGNSTLQNYTGTDKASNILDLLGIEPADWITTNTYQSDTIEVVETSTINVSATRSTLLSELGVSTGEYYIYNNGVKYTALISSDETIGSLMDTLKSFGFETSLVEGPNGSTLSVIGKGNSYVAKSNSITNASNVVEQLFTNGTSETKEYTGLEQTSEIVTVYSAATEDTLLSEFDNGLLISEGDLSVTVNGVTSIIKITADETIGSLMEKFQNLGLEATLSDGQIMIQSGYDTFTINTDGTTSNLPASIGLVYHNDLGGYVSSGDTVKATTTSIEEKTLSVANYADGSTKMGLLNISDGSLSIYRDGEKATIQINSEETFDDLKARLATAFSDLDLKFENGYLTIYSKDGNQVEVGSTTDTSNFAAITGIAKDENGNVVSARELYRVNADSLVTEAGLFRNGQITEGTFTIGDAVFTITDTTRLSDIISQINSNDEANATAYWDNIQGKFVIKSRTTGSALINIEAGTSNFTDIMGFTSSEWAADGSVDVTRMNVDTQEIGENAKISINGTTYTSTSNTITSDISRIKGLTINLKGLTEGSAVTLTVERDKETLANAISDVVDSYNELMTNVDEAISQEGDLHSETTLKLIRNQLRNLMTSSDLGTTVFRNLDAIGISVDSASANNISTTTESIIALTFNKDKFFEAYDADQDAVKDLIIGGTSNTGVFTKVETLIESALQSVSGYFAVTEDSYRREVQELDRKIVKANRDIEKYRARLEAKFSSMDLLIAQMQQQYSSFLIT